MSEKIFMLKSTGRILLRQTLYRRHDYVEYGNTWARFDPIEFFYEREDGVILKPVKMSKEIRKDLEYIGDL